MMVQIDTQTKQEYTEQPGLKTGKAICYSRIPA